LSAESSFDCWLSTSKFSEGGVRTKNCPCSCFPRSIQSFCNCLVHLPLNFLFLLSSFTGFYSWRNTTKGSWFMQSLCAELDENGKRYDLLTLLTFVSQRVAYDFESNTPDTPTMHQQKQIPCTTTMLTRILRFNDKSL
jgi:hypothetical protein